MRDTIRFRKRKNTLRARRKIRRFPPAPQRQSSFLSHPFAPAIPFSLPSLPFFSPTSCRLKVSAPRIFFPPRTTTKLPILTLYDHSFQPYTLLTLLCYSSPPLFAPNPTPIIRLLSVPLTLPSYLTYPPRKIAFSRPSPLIFSSLLRGLILWTHKASPPRKM